MSRLVVVSNRVPVPREGQPPPGGLAVALDSALKQRGGLWFGWSGRTSGAVAPETPEIIEAGNVCYMVVDLTTRDRDEYYNGYANRALWPLFHYRMDLTEFARNDMAGYFRVNKSFARMLTPRLRSDDLLWIHDYHLIPLAAELRAAGVENRMAFFLHIPFPPPDVLTALPAHAEIVRSLCLYDVVGFQTDYDAENFLTYLVREKVGRAAGDGWVEAYGRRIRVRAYPVGIETANFAAEARLAENATLVRRARQSVGGRELIIGVDRLDYSKGIAQRIEAFERFITVNPQFRGRVTYMQITPKSREDVPEYVAMERVVAELAGRVNGALSDVDWNPIRYVNRTIRRSALAGLYRGSRLGLVTPLRDGMNLVAKEYVAAQDPSDPGVLVLSRFAGAARELDAALLVNPYDIEDLAAAMVRGMTMPLGERRARWRSMMDKLEYNDVNRWCSNMLAALAGDEEVESPPPASDRSWEDPSEPMALAG
jgi:trehalose 6-phosphate synthase